MKEMMVLKLLDRFAWLFTRIGVDYPMLRCILKLKFTIDTRRVPTIYANQTSTSGNYVLKSMAMYLLYGVAPGMMMVLKVDLFTKMSMVFSISMFMMMMIMIADFSEIMLDTKDKRLLHTKPINAKTLHMAKLIHIFTYLSMITLSFSVITLFVGVMIHGWLFLPIAFLTYTMMVLFIIVMTSLVYGLVLHYYDGERLKNMINYMQIALTVMTTVGYQIAIRATSYVDLKITLDLKWWMYFLPISWLSAPFQWLLGDGHRGQYTVLAIIGIIVPIIAFRAYIKVILPYFDKNIAKLTESSAKAKKKGKIRTKLLEVIGERLTKTRQEELFFRLSHQLYSSERKLKLRIYPNIGMTLLLPIIFTVNMYDRTDSFGVNLTRIQEGDTYLSFYLIVAILANLVEMKVHSETYKGAWIYQTIPCSDTCDIMKGAYKSFMVKYILPIYLFGSAFYMLLFGPGVAVDLLVMFIVLIILSLRNEVCTPFELPHSQPFETGDSKKNIGVTIVNLFIAGIIAAIHGVVGNKLGHIYGEWILAAILALVAYWYWYRFLNRRWQISHSQV